MDFAKFKQTISKFSKYDIQKLLGSRIYDSLIDWSSDDSSYTKESLVDILVSINGFSLFKNKDFRVKFFRCLTEEELRSLLNDKESSYEDLASKAAKIEFGPNDFYKHVINVFLNSADYQFDEFVSEEKRLTIHRPETKFYELLDYQYYIKQQAIYELSKNKPIGRKLLIHMPTGTGKTKTTMHIVSHYLNFINKNGYVVWVAHNKELLNQALETFQNVWSHLGLKDIEIEKSWGVGDYYITKGVVFVTIQLLQSMRKNDQLEYKNLIKKETLFIYDECHKIGAPETFEVVKDFTKSTSGHKVDFIGLTATPGRTTEFSIENRSFAEFFDRIIGIDISLVNKINMQKNEAINSKVPKDVISYFQDRGILSRLVKEELTYSVDETIKQSLVRELKANREDFSKQLVEKIACNKARNSVILNRLKQLNAEGKPTIVFACSLPHAQMLSAFLNIENIPNALVYGDMPSYIRTKAINDFKDRDNPVNIIINFDILTTGFDATNIDCVFITRPTKSVILYSQMIGRGLRGPQMGGGETCLLIDVKENIDAYDENEAFSHFNSYWRK